jgi:large subunit ribosomal protein L15
MPVFEQFTHPSNTRKRKRRGRGIAAGRGKTAGRGQTGQKSRSGGTIHARFEGGRTPVVRKWGKFSGFQRRRKVHYYPVNLSDFAGAEGGTVIDLAYLEAHSLLPKKRRGVLIKLLGNGKLETKLVFKLHAYSNNAREKVEAAGGTCEVIE